MLTSHAKQLLEQVIAGHQSSKRRKPVIADRSVVLQLREHFPCLVNGARAAMNAECRFHGIQETRAAGRRRTAMENALRAQTASN